MVRAIGLSNTYDVDVVRKLSTGEEGRGVEVVQNRWYERNGWDKDVAGYCRENGIMYQYVCWFFYGCSFLYALCSIIPYPNPDPDDTDFSCPFFSDVGCWLLIQIFLDLNGFTETSATRIRIISS